MQLITVSDGNSTLTTPCPELAMQVLAKLKPSQVAASTGIDFGVPAHGEYWPGEGGINGGYVAALGAVPEHYLIFATKDAGRYVWGRQRETSKATDKRDGLTNTKILLEEGGHPAAIAASEYTADGHADFYLGAAAEMYQGWLNCPDKFDQDVYYYTSTQFSAYGAYILDFSVGYPRGDQVQARAVPAGFGRPPDRATGCAGHGRVPG